MNWTEIAILVLTFVVLLGIGVPVAYSIGLSSLVTILITMDPVIAFTTLAQRMATGIDSFSLLAIPFFVLAGQLMNKGGIASRLIDLARAMVGPLPGGLAFINILACMLFGAISGSSVAAASAIGGFMVPRMEKEGYDKAFGAAVNLTSASTGLVIPPSNILIVFSLASGGVSIAALFLAGYIPGLLIGLALMIVAGVVALKKGYKSNETTGVKIFFKSFFGALPSLLLLVIVIGGIIAGIFTATEASAIAVLYTLILSMVVYKEVKYKDLPRILLDTTLTTTIVLMLVATSMGMSWVLSYENIPQGVSDFLLNVSDNPVVILLIINLLLLAVGTFMDMTPAVLIFTPIFLPVVVQMGMNPIHFGIVMVMNLCIGLCTPPVGSLLFVGCSVAGLSIQKVLKPLLPLFLAMIAVLLLVTYVPALSLWLPELFGY
ncbi:TRAP transporter large permease subunit [Imperialibacter roseus]|jgi:tripartite ATP-independent transporter DctM subunit|uniref:TRAP transporter large permease subunit n=1 Tax=Imperialibacter roseus TaxID=1324217 RepID=A0ABZ0IV20_9BACT|nr:TRAP transporter large permease subunit [Imperialibacter roseus]WOK08893.1 TRAP transporter large permease subunit [Imperialibacter roseus]|tara:strand:- start:24135 stop:25433 length:1299 start_codon:yes stop_codon:yes gene_type:complete